jgi:hypothetical protein
MTDPDFRQQYGQLPEYEETPRRSVPSRKRRKSRRNPRSHELFDYSSRIAVGGSSLSPWEATAAVAGVTVVLAVLAYWSIKSSVAAVAPVAPVPVSPPVQPVPVPPNSPGY